jgi:hypothetical protein
MAPIKNQAPQSETNEQYLRNLYYNTESPTSYTGIRNLWKKVKEDKKDKEIALENLKEWLDAQYTYSLHKPYKRPAIYRKTMTSGMDDQWQADLVEIRDFSEQNEGYNYWFCVIDCFTKCAWVEPLKTKTGVETCKAFEAIFDMGRVPTKIQFDEGKEFYNKNFIIKTLNPCSRVRILHILARIQTKRPLL